MTPMSVRRTLQWSARFGRLEAASTARIRRTDYVGAAKVLGVLRRARDYWARECFGERARQAQMQSDSLAGRRVNLSWNGREPLLDL